eukprot:3414263-Rhodomonas_salina.2
MSGTDIQYMPLGHVLVRDERGIQVRAGIAYGAMRFALLTARMRCCPTRSPRNYGTDLVYAATRTRAYCARMGTTLSFQRNLQWRLNHRSRDFPQFAVAVGLTINLFRAASIEGPLVTSSAVVAASGSTGYCISYLSTGQCVAAHAVSVLHIA